MDHRVNIDPDIRRAQTPPAGFYRSNAVYQDHLESIFARTWQVIPPEAAEVEPNEAVPWVLLEGSLNEPLLSACDEQGRVRVLSNVCTHRGHLVATERCRARHLRCRYHGRAFAYSGRMVKCPGFEGAKDFPRKEDNLREVSRQTWGPLHFVRLFGDGTLEQWLGPVIERIGWWPASEVEEDESQRRSYQVEAQWALYCENYLEGFHIPYVHHALNKTLNLGDYEIELFEHCSLQVGIAAPGEPVFDLPKTHTDYGRRIGAYYFFVFPNTMLNFYPWGLSLNVVRPMGLERTTIDYRTFVLDQSLRESGSGAGLHQVEMEDEDVVESVQKGMASRLYQSGRYSPEHESAVHHFHRFLTKPRTMKR